MEIKIEYLYTIPNTYNLVLNGAGHCSTAGLVFAIIAALIKACTFIKYVKNVVRARASNLKV